MIKNVVYFFPTFSHFFITAADCQFWKVPATPRTQSIRTKSLFIVFWNVRMILTKWVIILECGKRLFWLALKTLLVCHVAVMTLMWLLTKIPKNLTLLEDISTKFIYFTVTFNNTQVITFWLVKVRAQI